MRQRKRNAKTEKAGLIAVELACNQLDLIWRDLLQEDVGVDGTIEVAIDNFPTGKLVGVQVKSGLSYFRSETEFSFKFYPEIDDVRYWAALSIPLFLFVYHPVDDIVYWMDITKQVQDRGDDPLGQAYLEFAKSNKVDTEFEKYLRTRFDLLFYDEVKYESVRSEFESIILPTEMGSLVCRLPL